MTITIDQSSGFCFGVVNAIDKAEAELKLSGKLYCLGHIVHNNSEVDRLTKKGLITINHEQFNKLHNCKVLIRAHGEPPQTYKTAKENNIELIDASCPVVLKLQSRIRKNYDEAVSNEQIVIFGKQGHAEVNGLVGQTNENAIVINHLEDLSKIDFSKPVNIFSQTTMGISEFKVATNEIRLRMEQKFKTTEIPLQINDTICRQVANRAPHLREFAANNNIILFVSGKDSSNGKVLYDVCKSINPNTYFVTDTHDLNPEWFIDSKSTGICGATSTPRWLMEEIAKEVEKMCML
jgi:4-hydroxy-3-methylbut-2-enyl diphosphate reductase